MEEEVLLDIETFEVLRNLEDSKFIKIALKEIKEKIGVSCILGGNG